MKRSTQSLLRLVISILYIVWGITAPLTLIKSILALNFSAILSAAVGLVMLAAGIYGLLGIKRSRARLFGTIILVLAVVSIVSIIASGSFGGLFSPIISAVLAWLYITCI